MVAVALPYRRRSHSETKVSNYIMIEVKEGGEQEEGVKDKILSPTLYGITLGLSLELTSPFSASFVGASHTPVYKFSMLWVEEWSSAFVL